MTTRPAPALSIDKSSEHFLGTFGFEWYLASLSASADTLKTPKLPSGLLPS